MQDVRSLNSGNRKLYASFYKKPISFIKRPMTAPLSIEEEKSVYQKLRNKIDYRFEKRYEKYGVQAIIEELKNRFPENHNFMKNARAFLQDLENGQTENYQKRFREEGRVFLPILQAADSDALLHLKIGVLEKKKNHDATVLRLYDGVFPKFTPRPSLKQSYPTEHLVEKGKSDSLIEAVIRNKNDYSIYLPSDNTGSVPKYLQDFLTKNGSRPLYESAFPPQKENDCFFHAPLFALLRESV